jgi:hypothetical protein
MTAVRIRPDGRRRAPGDYPGDLSLFCRHNRFTAECPICSKGTVLDPNRKPERRPRPSSGASSRSRRSTPAAAATRVSRGEFAAVGPYEDGREVRLERVPGGLRLAAWHAGQLVRAAPVIELADLAPLLAGAVAKELLRPEQAEVGPGPPGNAAPDGAFGASSGRSGELRDELRVERLADERVRIARWVLRPNRGWELQAAPVMLPAARYAQALAAAAAKGVLSGGPAE